MLYSYEQHADIGVFGGSGFYSLFDQAETFQPETPYGPASDKISIAEIAGKRVAFLPRHGADHRYLPAQVPYLANMWAMKQLGVKQILGPCAAGSLQPDIKIGSFVVCDQFVDRTTGRPDTFYRGPVTTHISAAEPYCQRVGQIAYEAGQALNLDIHKSGTMVVIQGPRFSTKAESRWFSQMGWHVVNMTGYPECILARELDMCYTNISLITDYDAGLDGIAPPVSIDDVMRIFAQNTEVMKELVLSIIKRLPLDVDCSCHHAVTTAR